MGPGTAGTSATAIHENVHLVVRHSNLHFPPLLNEGIAELYSTSKPVAAKVMIGSLIPRRQMVLMHEWVPLAAIVDADQRSAFYNGPLQITVAAGSTFWVALYADSPTQFNLKFDPTRLQAMEVKEGADFQNSFRASSTTRRA